MKTFIVDSFTNEAFKGNPAGVCLLKHEINEDRMQEIAKEFGHSETAFIQKTNKADTFTIRYFSPKREIPLCGHATLACAKVIFKNEALKEIHFITTENLDLSIRRYNDEIMMEFPLCDTVFTTVPIAVLDALGLAEVTNTSFSPKNKIIILEIKDSDLLAHLSPNFTDLVNSCENVNGVLVTSPSNDKEYDYHYRYFWPWAGTNEDPVTGGVQTFLAKYWGDKLDKKVMKAFQSSNRNGYMGIELKTDKVLLIGQAVIVLEGNLVAFD